MKKSIGRTLAHIDAAANTSARIHKDFFNSYPCYQQLGIPALPVGLELISLLQLGVFRLGLLQETNVGPEGLACSY
jgi:hypothetical protein